MLKAVIKNRRKIHLLYRLDERFIRNLTWMTVFVLIFYWIFPVTSVHGKSSKNIKKNVQNPSTLKKPNIKNLSKSGDQKNSKCADLKWISPRILPQAILGDHYTYKFQISGGYKPIYFSTDRKESVPPGLFLSARGLISGSPEKIGNYSFSVFACDSCPAGMRCVEKKFIIRVVGKNRIINTRVTPSTVIVQEGRWNRRKIVYIFENKTATSRVSVRPAPIRFESLIGHFSVHGKIIGQIKSHLKAEGQNVFKVEENIVIPPAMTEKAKDLKASQFVYTRVFNSKDLLIQKQIQVLLILKTKDNDNSKTSQSFKKDFQVNRLRVYFKNKGSHIRVEKDQSLPRLMASIEYKGSGTLKGHWDTGKKIISVTKRINSGKSLHLEFPNNLAFLTNQFGKHRIRFVIKSPVKAPSPKWVEYTVISKNAARFVDNQIVVSTGPDKKRRLVGYLRKKYGLKVMDTFEIKTLNQRITVYRTDKNIFELIKQVKKEKGVLLAQPNTIFKTMTEPKSDLQGISKSLNFKKLHANRRGKGVLVAVLDTGVDIKHRDLKNKRIFYKNLLKGRSYRAEIHGTAVAGIIGAQINNFGIEGIAPEAEIIALRTCAQISRKYPEGQGNTASIVKGIDISIQKKARIVNMSFGAPIPDPLIQIILREGVRRKIIFVAPVGNRVGQKKPNFPASSPNVLAVGGITMKNLPYPDKNLAAQAKVCAPAVNIFTTIPKDRHNFMTGTSMSSAIVSGILVLAAENNRKIHLDHLPKFKGNICIWAQMVLKLTFCN